MNVHSLCRTNPHRTPAESFLHGKYVNKTVISLHTLIGIAIAKLSSRFLFPYLVSSACSSATEMDQLHKTALSSRSAKRSSSMNPRKSETFLNVSNLSFAEELYARYLRDPSSVPADWRRYFEEFSQDATPSGKLTLAPALHDSPPFRAARNGASAEATELARLQNRVDLLIRNYRVRGHLIARLDPLDRPRPHLPELDPEFYGFSEADMERSFSSETLHRDGPLT